MNHAEAQFSEPRTNPQYHPQNVPELGKPPKLWARPNRHAFPQSESSTAFKLMVCQRRIFFVTRSLATRYSVIYFLSKKSFYSHLANSDRRRTSKLRGWRLSVVPAQDRSGDEGRLKSCGFEEVLRPEGPRELSPGLNGAKIRNVLGGLMPEARPQSRRDGPIVAWHEVPWNSPTQRNRPVGYGMTMRRPTP
jgi:hypothetical protein